MLVEAGSLQGTLGKVNALQSGVLLQHACKLGGQRGTIGERYLVVYSNKFHGRRHVRVDVRRMLNLVDAAVDLLVEQVRVILHPHRVHEAVLLGPEDIPGPADLEVAHRELEARPELGELLEGLQALARVVNTRPTTTHTTGTGSENMSRWLVAIASLTPRASASSRQSAPLVSIRVSTGRFSRAANCITRIALR